MVQILLLSLLWGTVSFYNHSFGGLRPVESIVKYHLANPPIAPIRAGLFQIQIYCNVSLPRGLNHTD